MTDIVGLLTLHIGEQERTRRLPRRSTITLGRGPVNGLEIREPWVPRELATLRPVDDGWVLTNGPRARVHVTGMWVDGDGARHRPGARLLLHEGRWSLDWEELDGRCRAEVDVHPDRAGERLPAFVLDSKTDQARLPRTDFAAYRIDLDALTRHRLAVVFRHLILEEPPPDNLFETAAMSLGLSVNDVKNLVHRLRRKLNRRRVGDELRDAEQLGVYLVQITGLIVDADLSP